MLTQQIIEIVSCEVAAFIAARGAAVTPASVDKFRRQALVAYGAILGVDVPTAVEAVRPAPTKAAVPKTKKTAKVPVATPAPEPVVTAADDKVPPIPRMERNPKWTPPTSMEPKKTCFEGLKPQERHPKWRPDEAFVAKYYGGNETPVEAPAAAEAFREASPTTAAYRESLRAPRDAKSTGPVEAPPTALATEGDPIDDQDDELANAEPEVASAIRAAEGSPPPSPTASPFPSFTFKAPPMATPSPPRIAPPNPFGPVGPPPTQIAGSRVPIGPMTAPKPFDFNQYATPASSSGIPPTAPAFAGRGGS